jgi:tellurite resistance protein
MNVEAYCVEVELGSADLTVRATNTAGRGALGSAEKSIPLRAITRTDLSPAGLLKNGRLTIEAGSDKTLIHFRRKQGAGVLRLYDALLAALPQTQVTARPVQPTQPQDPDPFGVTIEVSYGGTPAPTGPADAQWVAPGVPVSVGKRTLPGGMLYVGTALAAGNGLHMEPALINPRLPIDDKRPDWRAASTSYWPSYSEITPQARSAYLTWLAGGRQDPGAPVSWAFLFFYGLERRVLVDAARQPLSPSEKHLIQAEVERLLGIYGDNHSFQGYAGEFLGMLEAQDATYTPGTPPDSAEGRWQAMPRVQSAVGHFAKDGTPVRAEWALAWARSNAEVAFRTAATRCPDEFGQLFRARYTAKYGDGLVIKPGKRMLGGGGYRTASSGIGYVSTPSTVPDVFSQAAVRKALQAIVDDCTGALESYSRYLGRNPEGRGTLPAIALLPPELVPATGGELEALDEFLFDTLGVERQASIDARDLLAYWPAQGAVAKADAVALAQLLGIRGVGLEPDVRFGGPIPTAGSPLVLFRTTEDQPTAPSAEYTAATLIVHLAAAVAAADGHVHDDEAVHLSRHVEASLSLTDGERLRLEAHLAWLLSGQLKLTGLTKRLGALTPSQREAIGDFVVSLAAADGVVSPDEVRTLTAIFKLLGLDQARVYSSVHNAATTTRPASEPVTVRDPSAGPPSYAIPPRPRQDGPAPVTLDHAAIAAKLAETAEVSALLAGIFADEPTPEPALPEADPGGLPPVAGLDAAHSNLLRALAARDRWTRGELETLCAAGGLLPDGAVDTLNEAAYELAGDPVIDEVDTLVIDLRVAEEMLR